jgi:hypothetical protein
MFSNCSGIVFKIGVESLIIRRDFRVVQKQSGHIESKRGTDRNNNLPYLGILL